MDDFGNDFVKDNEETGEVIVIQTDTDEELKSIASNLCNPNGETEENLEKDKNEFSDLNSQSNNNSNIEENSIPNSNSNSILNDKINESTDPFFPPHELLDSQIPQTPLSSTKLSNNSSPGSFSLQHYENFNIRPVLITLVKAPIETIENNDVPQTNSDETQETKMPPLNKTSKSKKYKRQRSEENSEEEECGPDQEVVYALEDLIKKDRLPEETMFTQVIDLARKQIITAMLEEDYDRADALQDGISKIQKAQQIRADNNNEQNSSNLLKTRLEAAKESYKEIEAQYDEMIQNQKEDEMKRRSNLQTQQEQEIRLFQEKWERPEAMLPFSKPSIELLQIRKMQKAFALSHNFKEAKKMKVKAEQLQKAESSVAKQKAIAAMNHEYEQLLEKHRKEQEAGEMNWKRKLETLELSKEAALQSSDNVKKQLTNKLASPKMKKKESVAFPFHEKKDPLYSRKMRKQFNDYKKRPEKMRLEVKMDSSNIVRPKTSNGIRDRTPRKNKTMY